MLYLGILVGNSSIKAIVTEGFGISKPISTTNIWL